MEVLKEFEEYLKENYETNENQNTIRAYMTDVKQFIKFLTIEKVEIKVSKNDLILLFLTSYNSKNCKINICKVLKLYTVDNVKCWNWKN